MAWTELQPDGSSVAIKPETCINGHPTIVGNYMASGWVNAIKYHCRICGSITTRHRDGRETYQQDVPF